MEYPNTQIDKFYSDSLSDTPLAELARAAFLVKGSQILPWPEGQDGRRMRKK